MRLDTSPSQDAGPAAGPRPNALAMAYQPRRTRGALVSIAWNLALSGGFVISGLAARLLEAISPDRGAGEAEPLWLAPAFVAIYFGGYALANLPLDLWYGYVEERQFGLAKNGIRAWGRTWLRATIQHAAMFTAGCWMILVAQRLAPVWWPAWCSAILLILFVMTTWLGDALVPAGLFHFDPADDVVMARLSRLLGENAAQLPPVVIYTAPELRDFTGGLVGLAGRQKLLISRAAVEDGSDAMLRFAVLHDLGHRRYHHVLLSALAGWALVSIGLAICSSAIDQWAVRGGALRAGSAASIAWLAFAFSAWMALVQPLMAYLGRRLEYQADRHYLRHRTLDEMKLALAELSHRNLARTDPRPRLSGAFHPLPTVTNRIARAEKIAAQRSTS